MLSLVAMHQFENTGLPVRAALHPDGLYVAFRDIAVGELQDAFMQQTVNRMAHAPETIVCIAYADLADVGPVAPPAGIVFHVGRCGSTVISQALKHGGAIVYSEPLPINEILAATQMWPRAVCIGALRWLGCAFAAHATKPYVFKLSSWNTLFCDFVAEAFPTAPWVFSLRDPVEVGAAILARPQPWFLGETEAAKHITHVADPEARSGTPEEFCARLYGEFCTAIERLDRTHGKLVRYEELSEAVVSAIPRHFGLSLDDVAMENIKRSTEQYSKAPLNKQMRFAPDGAAKQSAASAQLRDAIASFARLPHDRLIRAFSPELPRQ